MEIVFAFLLLFGIASAVNNEDENSDVRPTGQENRVVLNEATQSAVQGSSKRLLPECQANPRLVIYRDLTVPYTSHSEKEGKDFLHGEEASPDE